MKNIYKYIMENIGTGNIDKQSAIQLVKLLKAKENSTIQDIAIIGVGAKYPMAQNAEEFWENLKSGVDCITDFPDSRRKDIDEYFLHKNVPQKEMDYQKGAYLESIDKFDYRFFRISPIEASLMDPNQRLFLETAYEAIEDSGYGGEKLSKSKTGVYIGHSGDLRESYVTMLNETDPTLLPSSIAGNLSSIIPSRVSYFLDLKGPSVLVNTACSSSLLSVHLACEALRNGECTMALAGGIKINLISLKSQIKIGIESSTGQTRAFDDNSDGTGIGEGVGVVVLKPLRQALIDNDHIYAVIKGSAINQDGTSAGITAPNVESQTDVLLNAWENSGIDPVTISYIEAHGTGTELGDPIEIDGIISAFRKYTDRKQFCGIGTVKSNIGHLYEGAGIVALIKAVLALQHKQIPPTLHFNMPNKRIKFENSPVYVTDKLTKWESSETPRRCGISSFGFSGTNCHIVLEEAPSLPDKKIDNIQDELNVLTISAKSQEALKKYIEKYKEFLHSDENKSINDVCFTANTGRGHYNYRLIIICKNIKHLIQQIDMINIESLDNINSEFVFCQKHNIIGLDKKEKSDFDITTDECKALTEAANSLMEKFLCTGMQDLEALKDLCELYVKGASVNWNSMYENKIRARISVPTYPFERKRCWLQLLKVNESTSDIKSSDEYIHPLLEKAVFESIDQNFYETTFNPDKHFVLSDHIIMGNYVIPGTTYLEMAYQAGKRYFGEERLELKDILFRAPVVLDGNYDRTVQSAVKKDNKELIFNASSKEEDEWVQHVSTKICRISDQQPDIVDVEAIKKECNISEHIIKQNELTAGFIKFGPRWLNYQKLYLGESTALAEISLPDQFAKDTEIFHLHPSLIDMAVNALSLTLGERYLPLSYGSFRIYGSAPAKFYSYIRRKKKNSENNETIVFDITLFDLTGNVFAVANDYVIKKVHGSERFLRSDSVYSTISWTEYETEVSGKVTQEGTILILTNGGSLADETALKLMHKGNNVIKVYIGERFERISDVEYIVGHTEKDYEMLMEAIKDIKLSCVLHMAATTESEEIRNTSDLEGILQKGIYSLFYFTRTLLKSKLRGSISILLISDYANCVSGTEKRINPWNAGLFGLGKTVNVEYHNLKCRCIDIDNSVDSEHIINEINSENRPAIIAYRDGKSYIEEIDKHKIDTDIDAPINIKSDGVYIITGGTGGIGLEICRYISMKNNANIALINRSEFPRRETWDSIIEKNQNSKHCNIINRIRNIEETGSKVEIFSADISDESELRNVLMQLKGKYGRINGIIHSAGVAGDGFIINKNEQDFATVLKPKVYGTWLLDSLTSEEDMDFFVMFSSIASLIGIPGQGDYSASNAYMDSYAIFRSLKNKKTLTINWPAWKETGMAVDYGTNIDTIFRAIPTALAIEAFHEVLNKDIKRVIIGEWNYNSTELKTGIPIMLGTSVRKKLNQQENIEKNVTRGNREADLKIIGKNDESYNEIEVKLSKLWGEVLGLDEINVFENFYELGGDSIIATRLLKEIEKEYPGILDITDVFAYSTVSKMAEYIESKTKSDEKEPEVISQNQENMQMEQDDLTDILERLERGEITASEVDKLIRLGDGNE